MSAAFARARAWLAVSITALLWHLPQAAAAHAFPTPFRLLFHPTDPARIAVALRPGLALTENGGAGWNFVCGAASAIAGNADYAAAFTPEGQLLIGAFTALYHDDGLGCGWSRLDPNSGLPQGRVAALALRGDGTVEALSAAPGASNGLFASGDGGRHFHAHGSPLADAMPTGFARAPSIPERLYLTAAVGDARAPALFVSTDDGHHWAEKPLAGALPAHVLAVDPRDPLRVYLLRTQEDGSGLPDRIELSNDAGDTFREVIALPVIGGFALAADGSALFVGSREGGLYRIEGDRTPELLAPHVHVGCLHMRGETLWVCGDDQAGDPFAVATSQDGGASLVPFLHSAQVTRLRTCGNPMTAQLCNAEWNLWKNDVFGSTLEPPLAEPDAGTAALAPDASSRPQVPRSAGIACRTAEPGSRHRIGWLPASVGILCCMAFRRRMLRSRSTWSIVPAPP